MKLLLVLIAIVAAAYAGPAKHVLIFSKSDSPRIISGSPAAVGQFQYQVGFLYETNLGMFICGGSLLNANWVLTAAHCVRGAFYFDGFMGGIYSDGRPEPTKQTFYTTTSIAHHDYESASGRNDIALLNFNTPVQFTATVQPIPLSYDHVGGGERLRVSGWGKTSDWSAASTILNYVDINSITNDQCKNRWQGNIFDGNLCCTGNPEHSPCQGDSGGPLVKNFNGAPSLVGVVSYGDPAGCTVGSPSVFARVQFYTQWINGFIGN